MKKSDAINEVKDNYKKLLCGLDLMDDNFDNLMINVQGMDSIKVEILCSNLRTAKIVLSSIKKSSKVLSSLGFEIEEIDSDDVRLIGFLCKK